MSFLSRLQEPQMYTNAEEKYVKYVFLLSFHHLFYKERLRYIASSLLFSLY